jgi:hypothetical protein
MLFLWLVVVALVVLIVYLNQRKKPLYTEEELNKPVAYNTYIPSEPLISMWETFRDNRRRFHISVDDNKVVTVLDKETKLEFKLKIYLKAEWEFGGEGWLYSPVSGFGCFDREETNWLCSKIHKHLQKRDKDVTVKRNQMLKERKRKKYIELYCK